MKHILLSLVLILLSGCSKDDTFAFTMEASFMEQFSNTCGENAE